VAVFAYHDGLGNSVSANSPNQPTIVSLDADGCRTTATCPNGHNHPVQVTATTHEE
jgi:hypothetical protein